VLSYISELNDYVERCNAKARAEREEKERAETQAARERLTPLDDRLSRHLLTIPIDIQREGLSLSALQVSLRGRRGGHPHPGELGDALRRLGFVRKRAWAGGSAGFRALWYPAEKPNQ
jgi:hypothetical protein